MGKSGQKWSLNELCASSIVTVTDRSNFQVSVSVGYNLSYTIILSVYTLLQGLCCTWHNYQLISRHTQLPEHKAR